nr:MAG TPA: hypothetical protein [Caudoviricetes sp.]DAO50608.1 MAG TPA: hypothetical protein [Caudoviricetes sp.]
MAPWFSASLSHGAAFLCPKIPSHLMLETMVR